MRIPRLPCKRIAAALALGVATTIAIAWYCAWDAVPPIASVGVAVAPLTQDGSRESAPVFSWVVAVTRGTGVINKRFGIQPGPPFGAAESRFFASLTADCASRAAMERHAFLANASNPNPSDTEFTVRAYGWPMPCMASERAFTAADSDLKRLLRELTQDDRVRTPGPFAPASTAGAVPTPASPAPANTLKEWYSTLHLRGRPLPARPLAVPFALCAALYSSAWLTLILTVPRLLTRKRAGQCRRCRYSLAGLPRGAPCPECGTCSP